ncbi:MAG: glycoside hydrolase domain-containing protein [Thermoguttaceae bacterium]
MRRTRNAIWWCGVLAAVGGWQLPAAGEVTLKVWPVDPLIKVLRTDVPPPQPPAGVVIDACRGEIENGQIAFRAEGEVKQLAATATPLVSADGSTLEAPQVRWVGYVPVRKNTEPHLAETGPQVLVARAPVEIPDPLLEDDSIAVEANRTGAVWLTVRVPDDAAPGIYRGQVALTADGRRHSIPVQVTVHAAQLPPAMTLKVVNWYYPVVLTHTYQVRWWDERFWELVAADARSMARHRQSVGHVLLHETIDAVEQEDGGVCLDFQHFDRMVETFRAAGLPYVMGSALAGRHEWMSKDFYAIPMKLLRRDGSTGVYPAPEDPKSTDEGKKRVWVTSAAFEKYLAKFLPAFHKHLEEKRWLDSYIQLQADEPVDTNAAAYVRLGQLVKKYAPKLRRAEANRATNIVGALDIWAPLLDRLDHNAKFFKDRQAAGDEIWFYTCERPRGRYMNRMIDYPLLKTRLLHWANFATSTTGFLHWGFNPSWGNPFQNAGDPPGDGHLVYPGVARLHGARPEYDKRHSSDSLRYEAMRDGIEDYELLRLLAARSPEKADTICRSVVRSLTDYTLDPTEFNRARRQLLEQLSRRP